MVPEWKIKITLSSQSPSESTQSTEKVLDSGLAADNDLNYETRYLTTLQYSVQYCRADYGSPELMYKVTYNEPVALDSSKVKPREVSVLEEISSIIYPQWDYIRKEDLCNDRPILREVDRPGKTTLRIHSPLLLNALRSIVKYSSAPPGNKDNFEDGSFDYPFKDLYCHKNELVQYKVGHSSVRVNHSNGYNEECDRHIDLLLKYLDDQSTIRYSEFQTMWTKGIPTTTIAGLQFLLKPGSEVYVRQKGTLAAFVIDRVMGGVHDIDSLPGSISATSYNVLVWNLFFDGTVIKRVAKTITVPVFDGEREIRSLPLYPTIVEDTVDGGAHRQFFITRGKKYFDFAKGPTFLEYTGSGLKPGWKTVIHLRVSHYVSVLTLPSSMIEPEWSSSINLNPGHGMSGVTWDTMPISRYKN